MNRSGNEAYGVIVAKSKKNDEEYNFVREWKNQLIASYFSLWLSNEFCTKMNMSHYPETVLWQMLCSISKAIERQAQIKVIPGPSTR